MQVIDFAKYLLTLNPEANAARLSLYHYLKNWCSPQMALSPTILNNYVSRCLSFSYWRENQSRLEEETRPLIESFLEQYNTEWPQNSIRYDLQIIEVASIKDLYEVCRNFTNKSCLESEKYRLLPDNENGIVALKMSKDGSLQLTYFDKLLTLRSGKIEPLNADLSVTYTAQLELAPHVFHTISLQPNVFAKFQVLNNTLNGSILRGYAFQRMEDLSGTTIHKTPSIFYPLKRLERFFVNRTTDPLYIELTQLLDQSIGLLKDNHPEAFKIGSAAIERGQNALNLIFPDDKLIALLLRELSHLLLDSTRKDSSWHPQTKSDLINL